MAREHQAHYIADADAIAGDEEKFADSVHLTVRGIEAMARRVARALIYSPGFEAIMRTGGERR